MKAYSLLAASLLVLFSCQHYVPGGPPVTAVNGKWTFEKDTVVTYWGNTVVKESTNNISAGSTITFTPRSNQGSMTYVANPDTTLILYYYIQNYNTALIVNYPQQIVYGVTRPPQVINYTIVKATDHELVLNSISWFDDPQGGKGEIYGNYYWTK